MPVMLTSEAEKQRWLDNNPPLVSWELHKGNSLVQAVRKAKEMGWKDKKVQVRFDKEDLQFYIEPYEEGCGCNGLLKYEDYFD